MRLSQTRFRFTDSAWIRLIEAVDTDGRFSGQAHYSGAATDWKTVLAYVTASVDEELLRRNEYLVAEDRILRAQVPGLLKLTDGERRTLAHLGKQLGRKAPAEVATIVRPDTLLAWHRRLLAKKFDDSKKRGYPGRPPVDRELQSLIFHSRQQRR